MNQDDDYDIDAREVLSTLEKIAVGQRLAPSLRDPRKVARLKSLHVKSIRSGAPHSTKSRFDLIVGALAKLGVGFSTADAEDGPRPRAIWCACGQERAVPDVGAVPTKCLDCSVPARCVDCARKVSAAVRNAGLDGLTRCSACASENETMRKPARGFFIRQPASESLQGGGRRNVVDLDELRKLGSFGAQDVVRVSGLTIDNARIWLSRHAQRGSIRRVGHGVYVVASAQIGDQLPSARRRGRSGTIQCFFRADGRAYWRGRIALEDGFRQWFDIPEPHCYSEDESSSFTSRMQEHEDKFGLFFAKRQKKKRKCLPEK